MKHLVNIDSRVATSTGLPVPPGTAVEGGLTEELGRTVLPAHLRERFTHVSAIPAHIRERFTHISVTPETVALIRARQAS